MNTIKQRILVLCTGNSCRSQMAEGLFRHLAGDRFEAFSAGTHPTGINPRAVQAMDELDIDISGHKSQPVDEYVNQHFDYVITVCDHARESCPVFPNTKQTLHWPFEDPAIARGTEESIMAVFRKVRDQIQTRIEKFAAEITHKR